MRFSTNRRIVINLITQISLYQFYVKLHRTPAGCKPGAIDTKPAKAGWLYASSYQNGIRKINSNIIGLAYAHMHKAIIFFGSHETWHAKSECSALLH